MKTKANRQVNLNKTVMLISAAKLYESIDSHGYFIYKYACL